MSDNLQRHTDEYVAVVKLIVNVAVCLLLGTTLAGQIRTMARQYQFVCTVLLQTRFHNLLF